MVQFLSSGPAVALVLEGREAVTVVRTLMGPTDGTKAAPGTIRGDFALTVQNNLIHGSDSPENAAAEIALWFRPEELVTCGVSLGSAISLRMAPKAPFQSRRLCIPVPAIGNSI